jgi:hypothetical protein
MKMLNVAGSDAIRAIGYDPQNGVLRIEFNHGQDKSKKYRFCGVPQQVFDGLLYSTTKGEYYDKHIRGKFLCTNA